MKVLGHSVLDRIQITRTSLERFPGENQTDKLALMLRTVSHVGSWRPYDVLVKPRIVVDATTSTIEVPIEYAAIAKLKAEGHPIPSLDTWIDLRYAAVQTEELFLLELRDWRITAQRQGIVVVPSRRETREIVQESLSLQ